MSDISSKRRELNSYLLKACLRNLMGKIEPRGEFEHYRRLFYEDSGLMPDARTDFEKLALEPTDISEHLTTLSLLTRALGLKTVLELGTREGYSTIAFLEAAKAIGGTVTSVDIEPCPKAHERVAARIMAGEATADDVLKDYCTIVYARCGSYEGAARILGLDRRTVKSRIDPDLLRALTGAGERSEEPA